MSLEICVFSIEAAIKADKAGANRIELCSNPGDGGTTPHHALIKAACEKTALDVFPIIRPSGGGFSYSNDEFNMIKEDILFCKEAGCQGIATGILHPDNTVDVDRMQEIVLLAAPMDVTFIRAFDLTPDPEEALQDLITAGCKRVLTSGQAQKAEEALPLIKKLTTLAKGKISIMPGSGVRPNNIQKIIENTGVVEIHSSARIFKPNIFKKVDELGFGQPVTCNEEQIAEMRKILDTF
ncbi:copper homeostasis protein CutC [Marinilabilia rubra]|uniref:PF03932 family protein CutC n=1 Tax=Marinilabilia rubra TaxID=2162893 RepID=A0A2U2B494_9BACT|nr:copper homeostasis protein CutC [Marinilabilia rubra]